MNGLPNNDSPGGTVVYDSSCKLCSYLVGQLSEADKMSRFSFVSFQHVKEETISGYNPRETIVFLDSIGNAFANSDALLEILKGYKGFRYRFFYLILRVIPGGLRDWLYKFIAKRRYRLFGVKRS